MQEYRDSDFPYFAIELSEYTESEYEEDELPQVIGIKGPTKKKVKKREAIVSQKRRKYEKVGKVIKSVQQKMRVEDLFGLVSEVKNLEEEIKRLGPEIDAEGYPLEYLKALEAVYEDFVLNRAKEKDKKKKRQAMLLKKLVKRLREVAADDLEIAKQSEEWSKNEETLRREEEEREKELERLRKEGAGPENEQEADAEEDEEEEPEVTLADRKKLSPEDRRKFWLVKTTKKKRLKKRKKGGRRGAKRNVARNTERNWEETGEFDSFHLTKKSVDDKLTEIFNEMNGFKEEELESQLRFMEFLMPQLKLVEQQTAGILCIMNMRFELSKTYRPMMHRDSFGACLDSLNALLDILDSPNFEELEVKNFLKGDGALYSATELNSFLNIFLEALDGEWWYAVRLLRSADPEYVSRLADLTEALTLYKRAEKYWAATGEEAYNGFYVENLFRQLKHFHVMDNDFVLSCPALSDLFESTSISEWVQSAHQFILQNSTNSDTLARTTLYYVFHKANDGGEYALARDLFLNLHPAQLTSSNADLVAAYNRALCRIALQAFKQGLFVETRRLLESILASGSLDRHLFQYDADKTAPLKLPDPTVYLPYHLHLNTANVLTAYLVSSVMTESALLFRLGGSSTRKDSHFSKILRKYGNTLHVNAADNSRDLIFKALHKIMKGQIRPALESLKQIPLIINHAPLWEAVQGRVPIECLNCYLYLLRHERGHKFPLAALASLFNISTPALTKELAARIFRGSLPARLDLATETLIFLKQESSLAKGQNLADRNKLLNKMNIFSELAGRLGEGVKKGDKEKVADVLRLAERRFPKKGAWKSEFCFDSELLFANMGNPLGG